LIFKASGIITEIFRHVKAKKLNFFSYIAQKINRIIKRLQDCNTFEGGFLTFIVKKVVQPYKIVHRPVDKISKNGKITIYSRVICFFGGN